MIACRPTSWKAMFCAEWRAVEAITSTPGVASLVHLRTQHLGPDEILVGARVAFDLSLDAAGVAAVVDVVEQDVKRAVPSAGPIYVEPAEPA